MRNVVAALLVLASVGCRQSVSPLDPDPSLISDAQVRVLTTERDSYAAGETAVVILTNTFRHAIGYNLCVSTLERQRSGSWHQSELDRDGACTMELRILQPGSRATYSRRLNPALPAGEYRIRTTLENLEARTREPVVSTTFRVTR
ncbi:MAG: hypothetical protein KY464_10870 [Gemmatimonadetes bacterium]|nr:hypothetical protein [Gemmatimonadota bacterium]